MFYCQVTIKYQLRGEVRETWFVLESKHPNMAGVYFALTENGAVYGNRLEVQRDPNNPDCRVVTQRQEVIVMKESIVAFSAMQTDLYDIDGTLLCRPEETHALAAAE